MILTSRLVLRVRRKRTKRGFPFSILNHKSCRRQRVCKREVRAGFAPGGLSTKPQLTSSTSRWHKDLKPAFSDRVIRFSSLCLPISSPKFAALCKPPIPLAPAALRSSAACHQTTALAVPSYKCLRGDQTPIPSETFSEVQRGAYSISAAIRAPQTLRKKSISQPQTMVWFLLCPR